MDTRWRYSSTWIELFPSKHFKILPIHETTNPKKWPQLGAKQTHRKIIAPSDSPSLILSYSLNSTCIYGERVCKKYPQKTKNKLEYLISLQDINVLPPKNLIFQITNSLLANVGQKTQKDKKTNAFPSDVTQFVSQPRERHDDQENED